MSTFDNLCSKLRNYESEGKSMKFNNNSIGVVIRRLRLEKELTQEVLSGLAGITRTHLTAIENGNKNPNFETVWKLANALSIDPHVLVYMIEEETKNYSGK